jgi:SAM-dependent methyltransferase
MVARHGCYDRRMIPRRLRRLVNGARKVAAGLRPFSESVWPGVRNDLFLAHESIYRFAAGLASGARVLDAGCGTGYGSFILTAAGGAASVVGLDRDAANLRYARRRYAAPHLEFRKGDLSDLRLPPASIDLIVASNSLEHLREPVRFFVGVKRILARGGRALIDIPPILSLADVAAHRRIRYRRNILSVDDWLKLFARTGFRAACFAHRMGQGSPAPDFGSPFPSRLSPSDFVFLETTRDGLYAEPNLTAVFLLERAG